MNVDDRGASPVQHAASPADLRREVEETKAQVKQRIGAVEAASWQEADDRSMIAKWVMRGAGASVAAVYLFLILKAWVTGDWNASAQAAVEILKSVILPVVTLVLGYYFGRSGRS